MRYFFYLLIFAALCPFLSCKRSTLFEQIPASHSGVHFNNRIIENDSINPLDVVNIYNGGGVGIGDFNNDGLPDIYFTGNMVSNKLYLNKGDFKFEDVTDQSGVGGAGRWGRGVAIIDINNDGLPDIYVCNTLLKDSLKRRNLLYINQGNNKNGIPRFKEMAKEYGLDIHLQSTMSSFFDMDNDGDLDMYLTVNEASANDNPNRFRPIIKDGTHRSTGKLFRNDSNPSAGHPVFHDVSMQAGIKTEGYGHATTIVDLNQDGWKDIYVTDDFLSNNILYINNHDGTFTDRAKQYFKHTSANAMGQDIQDINNDGLADVFELDMNPEDNYRKKMMMSANSYQTYQNFDAYGYQYQYVRNTLQLNRGPKLGQNDSIGNPAFSEISFMSGIAQTDWSWCPLITDFNNDGFRDIVITNGYPKDVTDHDFITYRNEAFQIAAKTDILNKIPEVKLHNYAFQNKGDLTFSDESKDWGLATPTFSNGAVYADLNNDGAMDMVINNINDEAMIYKNTSRAKNPGKTHFLQVKFKGNSHNINGLGAFVNIYYNHGQQQVYENNPYRGYLSSVQNMAHFGLGSVNLIDSAVVKWPNGKKQVLKEVKADQVLKVNISNAHQNYSWQQPAIAKNALFKEVTDSVGIKYKHLESDFIDFNIQKLLPHKLSEYTPALAVGDVDGNGFEDIIIGGNAQNPAQIFLQQHSGKFVQRQLFPGKNSIGLSFKDEGLLLFDANGDNKPDLYVASGGYANAPQSPAYQDRLYLNDGKGNFTLAVNTLPKNLTSKFCVRALDYNRDGKLDLFVSGRVDPWNYPKPVSSFIFRNDSQNGLAKFTDVTNQVAPGLKNIGLVCDALFTDYNNDGWPDLVVAGEWMPITFLKNEHGIFKNETTTTGLKNDLGWWNTIAAGDFRHTGRMDYIVGNVGLNTLYQASDKYPVYITAKDFDKNGSYAAIPSLFLPDQNGDKKEFPAQIRDDLLKQMISMKKKFTNYKSFATATMDDILSPEQRKDALRLKANMLQSCYVRNDGNGKFTLIPLPKEAQISVLNGIVVDDFDGDGNLDVAINGNDYGTDVSTGRYDAFNGLILKGDGKGNFKPLSILQSGIYLPGNGKALVKLQSSNGKYLMAASQNRDNLKIFQLNKNDGSIMLQPADISAKITYKNSMVSKQEFYYGATFLSQSGRFLKVDKTMKNVKITDTNGHTRTVDLN
ncbi:VCBS repeat-containing protein [Mucilaginibacter sp.]|uniref:VCBS repeat-containing protein n=1 Tax=Mucilaginibacter sp. TaxID=1882438 RepID=UPI003B007D33